MERLDGSPREIKNRGASQRVLEYLRQNPDIVLPYKELQRELDLPDYTVTNSVQLLIGKRVADIERPIKGMVIYHSGNGKPVQLSDAAKAALAQQNGPRYDAPSRETQLRKFAKELGENGVVETDMVSAYPDAIQPDTEWHGPTMEQLRANAEYGKVAMPATVQAVIDSGKAPLFEYIGKMEAYSVIRDRADDLYVAVPLMEYLKR
jgi:hypothetical protein